MNHRVLIRFPPLLLPRTGRLCGSTGRLASIHTLSLSTPGPDLPAQPAPDSPNYNIAALVTLNRIYTKAIAHANSLQASDDGHESKHRTGFEDAWRTDLRAWASEWPDISASRLLLGFLLLLGRMTHRLLRSPARYRSFRAPHRSAQHDNPHLDLSALQRARHARPRGMSSVCL